MSRHHQTDEPVTIAVAFSSRVNGSSVGVEFCRETMTLRMGIHAHTWLLAHYVKWLNEQYPECRIALPQVDFGQCLDASQGKVVLP